MSKVSVVFGKIEIMEMETIKRVNLKCTSSDHSSNRNFTLALETLEAWEVFQKIKWLVDYIGILGKHI